MSRTHGLWRRPEYKTWENAIQRCTNPNHSSYERYGGRGIRVCEEWRDSFLAFFEHVGPRPSPAHSIDRIDNDGDYEPGNVRWATDREQRANTRRTRRLTFQGRTQSLAMWAQEMGIRKSTLHYRFVCLGWSAERALTTPVQSVGGKKLQREQVEALHRDFLASGLSMRVFAADRAPALGVSPFTIKNALGGQTWRDVYDEVRAA